MSRSVSRLALVALVAQAWTGGGAHASPAAQLDEARRDFRAQDCASAMPLLSFLLYPKEQLAQSEDLIEAHTMLGACQCDTGKRDDAKAEFEKVLRLDPEHTLGELAFSSCAMSAFAEIKADREAAKKRDADLRAAADARAAAENYLKNLVVYEPRSYAFNFFPFGAGQFSERRVVPGLIFASTETLAGGISAGVWIYLVSKYGLVSKNVPLVDGPGVLQLQQIEIGAGIAFIGIYAVGVVDALLHYKAGVLVPADELPPELRTRPQPPKKTSLRDRLHFGPIATASGLGIGLALEND